MRHGVYKDKYRVKVYPVAKGKYIVDAIDTSVSFTTGSLKDIKFDNEEN